VLIYDTFQYLINLYISCFYLWHIPIFDQLIYFLFLFMAYSNISFRILIKFPFKMKHTQIFTTYKSNIQFNINAYIWSNHLGSYSNMITRVATWLLHFHIIYHQSPNNHINSISNSINNIHTSFNHFFNSTI